jgi:predicted lipoprotein with Yx(FWY)xxD motif
MNGQGIHGSRTTGWTARILIGAAVAGVVLSACSSSPSPASGSGGQHHAAGQSLSASSAGGIGALVVDGRGRTVYVLLDGQQHDVACTSGSGCTSAWPPIRVPMGAMTPSSGGGVHAALVGASGGQATYHGWRLYEFSGDTGPGQAAGIGTVSFGGTWYALRPSGDLVSSADTTTSSAGGGW